MIGSKSLLLVLQYIYREQLSWQPWPLSLLVPFDPENTLRVFYMLLHTRIGFIKVIATPCTCMKLRRSWHLTKSVHT